MNKSMKVRAIYHELKNTVGNKKSDFEIIECAGSLVELFSIDESLPNTSFRTGGTPFENRQLSSVYADGGWRVFWHELYRGDELFNRDEWETIDPFLATQNMEDILCQL